MSALRRHGSTKAHRAGSDAVKATVAGSTRSQTLLMPTHARRDHFYSDVNVANSPHKHLIVACDTLRQSWIVFRTICWGDRSELLILCGTTYVGMGVKTYMKLMKK